MNRCCRTALRVGLIPLFFAAILPAAVASAQDIEGYYIGGDDDLLEPFRTQGSGWTSSASGSSGLGRPVTLTWSIVPDNTQLPTGLAEPASNSSLIAFLDGIHHSGSSPGGADLTQRNWWQLMDSAFERWDELAAVDFNYEANDDSRRLGTSSGAIGVRGDYRIGGHSIDGQTSPTFLAYNFFPNNSDMVIDTDEINRWGNATNNYRLFRNMMMHEIGHGIGLNHVESFDINPTQDKFQFGTFLMEPILASSFDGPQFDDILGAHRLYGDVNESGTGNETASTATLLGSLRSGQTLTVGADAADTFVGADETDFVSIDDDSDVDFFQFSIKESETVALTLTPLGPTYDEGSGGSGNNGTQRPFVSSAKSDLTLALYDSDGSSVLQFSNDASLGLSEVISDFHLTAAGDYFVRIGGLNNAAQFFQLDVFAVPEPNSLCLLICGSAGWALKRHR